MDLRTRRREIQKHLAERGLPVEMPSLLTQEPPAGYQWVGLADPFVPYTCEACGASVAKGAVTLHDAWHALQSG